MTVMPDDSWDTDHLAEAKGHLQLCSEQMQKIVAPALELRVALATAHALTAIAEALDAISFDDPPLHLTDKHDPAEPAVTYRC